MFLLLSPLVAFVGFVWSGWATLRWRRAWRVLASVPLVALAIYAAAVLLPDAFEDPSSHNLLPFEIGMLFWPGLLYMAVLATFRSPPGWNGPPPDDHLRDARSREVRSRRVADTVASTEVHVEREALRTLVARWRDDPGGTYRTWFLWEERLKNFRAIRSGVQEVVREIEAGTFGAAYRGSSLETVVASIAEQRQVFRGADHAFLWKPKLRIPDIYESADNQRAFGAFLGTCTCCGTAERLVDAVRQLDARKIKGLGPAVANVLYFLHPTWIPPFNTAIVKGWNAITGANVRLGRWDDYLAMRDGILRLNAEHADLLSNDLGAIGGLLFDVGSGRWTAPPLSDDAAARAAWEADLARVRAESARERNAAEAARASDRTHTEVQGWLRDLGRALGFDVWIAANDRSRPWGAGRLADGCLERLPAWMEGGASVDAIRLIDVLWLRSGGAEVAAAFEVEHSTSIYSGIVRLLDLALSAPDGPVRGLYLVAPDGREEEVRAQLTRPAFRRVADLRVRYLPYGELERHREAMARFGDGTKPIEAAARLLV